MTSSTETVATVALTAATTPSNFAGEWRWWQRFKQLRLAQAAALFLLLQLIVAVAAPLLAPYSPEQQNLRQALQGPSADHWLGTDAFGRDTLSRILYGTRLALRAIGLGVGLATLLGLPIGLVAGYYGGWVDRTLMWLVDLMFALPGTIVALTILAVLGSSLLNAMIAVGVVSGVRFARLVRGVVLAERTALYVTSAQVTGVRALAILARHLLPNIAGPLIVQLSQLCGAVLLIEASLSFLGLGVGPSEPSWGRMLADARIDLATQPFLPLPPGLAITLTTLAFNWLGDGLLDAIGRTELRKAKPKALSPASAVSLVGTETQAQTEWTTKQEGTVLAVRDLCVQLVGSTGQLMTVVDGVSLALRPSETLGLVGESGSGKTMTALALLGLTPPQSVVSGSITLGNRELSTLNERAWSRLRGNQIAMIFQEPMAALNPALTVGRQIAEPLQLHQRMRWPAARQKAMDLLQLVQVPAAETRIDDYPHQFSGGMAQRVMIARALACQPQVLIADEPTTALDVTVQAQVLDVLARLQAELGMALLLITHDLGVVARLCQRVAVMYAGQIVELATVEELFRQPQHPYTSALLAAMPSHQSQSARLTAIPGQPPHPETWPVGCRFAERCPHVIARCCEEAPLLRPVQNDHWSRCVRAEELAGLDHPDL